MLHQSLGPAESLLKTRNRTLACTLRGATKLHQHLPFFLHSFHPLCAAVAYLPHFVLLLLLLAASTDGIRPISHCLSCCCKCPSARILFPVTQEPLWLSFPRGALARAGEWHFPTYHENAQMPISPYVCHRRSVFFLLGHLLEDPLFSARIPSAKNEQQRHGRSSFVSSSMQCPAAGLIQAALPAARAMLVIHFLLVLLLLPHINNAAGAAADANGCIQPQRMALPRSSERGALLAFRGRLGNGHLLQSWDEADMSSWKGVTVGGQGHVLKLELAGLGLLGELYPFWDGLPWLQVMNLSHNLLHGTFDVSSSCWTINQQLAAVDLSSNRLLGPLRQGLRRLQGLQCLNLSRNGFFGELPRGMFELGSLEVLDLSINNFTGLISPDFQLLRSLRILNLAHNNFSGTFPASNLSRIPALRRIDVSANALEAVDEPVVTGSSGGFFEQLQMLDLSNNRLTGELPSFAFGIKALEVVNLSRNEFTGTIPADTRSGHLLQVLDLGYNHLTGNLSSIIRFQSLRLLNLAANNLSGSIPAELGRLENLTSLDLCANLLGGAIPDTISSLQQLVQLKVSVNQFTQMPVLGSGKGGLPPRLRVLSAGNNLFTGPLLVSNSSPLLQLEVLYLPQNGFTGPIPPQLGRLASLKKLMLNENSFEGTVPALLANCDLLEEIWLNDNRLMGPVPGELFTLGHLRMLVLANNSLSGVPFPGEVSQCKTLEVLWLEQNSFSGPISSEIGDLPNLLMLSLASNRLNGTVPASIGKLNKLVGLDLGFNSLSGTIPNDLAGLSWIQFLFLSNNQMEGPIPGWIGELSKLRALDFSFNSFSGAIPSGWKNSTLTSYSPRYSDSPPSALVYNNEGQRYIGYALPTTLDFSHNQLVGSIPAALGALRNLQILNLSQNKLGGAIPPSLGNVPALLKLDLSSNNLTGGIPTALSKLTFLSELNISHNNLQGAIPDSGQFPTFGKSSFTGNPDLCGLPLLSKCPSSASAATTSSGNNMAGISVVQKLIPLYIVIAGSLGFCGFWAFFIILIRKRHKLLDDDEDDDRISKKKQQQLYSSEVSTASDVAWINPKELASATNNYSQANIIGDGGFGIVYKATLCDGSTVAVKKLITDGGFGTQGEREFLAEMQTLGKIKHGNLVCLRGYCCNGRDRILVYKYLKNGSLDTWLHCRDDGLKPLDWKTRLRIIVGAARGISFLHHECFPPIVHRDIKASNILLDEEFEAHMADFGLARLMRDAGDTHVSTDVAGTVGYIPPEYNSSCMATMRGDVYSFGVVVLETITGKRPTDAAFRRAGGIGQMVAGNVSRQELESAIEAALLLDTTSSSTPNFPTTGEIPSVSEEILEVMRIACLCCVEKPGKRPEMRQVVRMLEGVEQRRRSSSAAAAAAAASLVSPPSADGGSKHFLNNVEI